LASEPDGGLILFSDSFTTMRQPIIVNLTKHYRLPSISPGSHFAKDGGLMEYSNTVDLVRQYRQAAIYVDDILRGMKPANLPIQAPDRYRLVINLQTAKALGLTVSNALLALADEVIE
jgi:putative tryptophan/tyrosine transport system substrate-binding protein